MSEYPMPVTVFVDQVARDEAAKALVTAEKAESDIVSHEELCAVRYQGILDAIGTIKRILGWAGGTVFSLLIATLGWLVVTQINRNDDDKELLRAQIEVLQRQAPQQQMTAAPAPATR